MKSKIQLYFFLFLTLFFSFFKAYCEEDRLQDVDEATQIKSLPPQQERCQKFNKKLLLNVDQIYYFKDCSLHFLSDTFLMFLFIQNQNLTPLKMAPNVYSALKIGKPYTLEDYYAEFPNENKQSQEQLCEKYNGNIVSSDDVNYYFVEDCHKRKIQNFSDVEKFNQMNKPMQSISKFDLNHLKEGKQVLVTLKDPPLKEETEVEIQKKLPSKSILCKDLNHKVTAFFESFYYVENCTLLPISDFDLSVQVAAQNKNGVQELTIEQMLGLKVGKSILSKDVIKKLEETNH